MSTSWPLPQRQEHLKYLQDHKSSEGTFPVYFQNTMRDLPIYRVSIDLPCYRLANGRTRAAQAEDLATHGLAADFFEADPDSERALEAQHGLLKEMVREKNLLNVLSREQQTEPLLIDRDGYVVNGNRRLCAMRILREEDPETYVRFGHVRVVVLPSCTESDIRELEARLQVKPDTRADYTWVDLALMQRALRQDNMSDNEIGQLYDMDVPKVQQHIRMLDAAEAYLADRGWPRRYSRVSKNGLYAFQKLLQGREACGPEQERDALTSISYLLIDDPSGGRLYERIPILQQNLAEVVARLKEELPLEKCSHDVDGSATGSEEDLLGGTVGDSDGYGAVATALADPANRDPARAIVQNALEEIQQRDRERKDAQFCLNQVRQAHTYLAKAANALDETTATAGIEQHLNNIELQVQRIREWLDARSNS